MPAHHARRHVVSERMPATRPVGRGQSVGFERAAFLPAPSDNVAIATRRLDAGAAIRIGEGELVLSHTVLEGHRFATEPIEPGAGLLSWGLPFGTATRLLEPGEYACNERILTALAGRDIDFELPAQANFSDRRDDYVFRPSRFRPGRQVEPVARPGTFRGFRRRHGRGVGTRNHLIVLAATSRSNAFARLVAQRFAHLGSSSPTFDGVAAVTHTEGDSTSAPHNRELVLRALAGLMVHPNVGAALVVDYPGSGLGLEELRGHMAESGRPIDEAALTFMSIDGDLAGELDRAERLVRSWLPTVAAAERTEEPLSSLKVALQCGGSDAFSGVSGNALAGAVAKRLIRHGGSAMVAETDELIGAEAYVLRNVRNLETAQRLLARIEAFKVHVENHGATAEGNPSGGNNYRGLYNIALKSLGAARKFDPEVRLDHVLDYAQPMVEPGSYFMDSPGNDLESIAGEVASGCNLILFTTGNGSITNFPFVPTLKFATTSGRFLMLEEEMDVDAGRYNEGEPMPALADEVFGLARAVASGRRTKGERAGHSQVQLWRDWPQVDASRLAAIAGSPSPDGVPLDIVPAPPSTIRFRALQSANGPVLDQVALVMPTSLCSGQVARMVAAGLDEHAARIAIRRYVALVHTEGCGSTNTMDLVLQTLLGHLQHPFVRRALLLEHGCETTHNDAVRSYLRERNVDSREFGWASIQLDGGIRRVQDYIAAWFERELSDLPAPPEIEADAGSLTVALIARGRLPEHAAIVLADFARGVVAAGGTVVVPSSGSLIDSSTFSTRLFGPGGVGRASLRYGQPFRRPGLHVMDSPTSHSTESITGLGGTGVQLMVGHVGDAPFHAHPMIPLLQVSGTGEGRHRFGADLDLELDEQFRPATIVAALEARVQATASRSYVPRLVASGMIDFQLTRGRLGVSM